MTNMNNLYLMLCFTNLSKFSVPLVTLSLHISSNQNTYHTHNIRTYVKTNSIGYMGIWIEYAYHWTSLLHKVLSLYIAYIYRNATLICKKTLKFKICLCKCQLHILFDHMESYQYKEHPCSTHCKFLHPHVHGLHR